MARYSCDSHVVEPAEVFEGLDAQFGDRAPRVLTNDAGDKTTVLLGGVPVPVGRFGIAGHRRRARRRAEPVHGTAPDIAGRNQINPTATLLSAAMLLAWLGFDGDAARLETAVDAAIAAGDRLTPDVGGGASTTDFASAARERL